MWFLLIFSLLTTTILPTHGKRYTDEIITLSPYVPAIIDKEIERPLSREIPIFKLLQRTREIYFPDDAKYKDSWLQKLEIISKNYAKAREHLKDLKKGVETGWHGKQYTTLVIDNTLKVPQIRKRTDVIEKQLRTFYKIVYNLINEIERECFGKDFETILQELIKLNQIDHDKESILKFRIEMAFTEIEKQMSSLEMAPKEFNYNSYFEKLKDINELQDTLRAKVGSPENFINRINNQFDVAAAKVEAWFRENENAQKTVIDVAAEFQQFAESFMTEIKLIFNCEPISATQSILSNFDDQSTTYSLRYDVKEEVLENLTNGMNSIQNNPRLKEFLNNVKTLFEYGYGIEETLADIDFDLSTDDLGAIAQNDLTIDYKTYSLPSSKMVEKVAKMITDFKASIQNPWHEMLELWFGRDADELYEKFASINPNMQITEEQRKKIHNFVKEIPTYVQRMNNAKSLLHTEDLIEQNMALSKANGVEDIEILQFNSLQRIHVDINKSIQTSILKQTMEILHKSIQKPKDAKNAIISIHRRMVNGIGSLFRVELEKEYLKPADESKLVTFELAADSEEFDNILFGRLIDDKINLINRKPSMALGKTKITLETIKTIINYVFDMYNQLKPNSAVLERICSSDIEPFASAGVKFPDDKTMSEIDEKQKLLAKTIKSSLNVLRQLCNDNIHQRIFETVRAFDANYLPEINEKLDLIDIQAKYNELMIIYTKYKQLIHEKMINRFRTSISNIKKFISELKNNPSENFVATKNRQTELIGEFRAAVKELEDKLYPAKNLILDIKVIEILETSNKLFVDKLIDDKIKLLPQTAKLTKDVLEILKKIPKHLYGNYANLKFNWIELERDNLNGIKQLTMDLGDGLIKQFPDEKTFIEIENRQRNLIEAIKNGFEFMNENYNGHIHRQLLETLKTNYKNTDIDVKIEFKRISTKCDAFKQIIHEKTNAKYLNAISDLKPKPELYKTTKTQRFQLIEKLRIAHEDLSEKIQNANKNILDIKVMEMLKNINLSFLSGLINEKLAIVPDKNEFTKITLESLKNILKYVNDMQERMRYNLIQLKIERLKAIKPIDLELIKGTVEKYPDDSLLKEIDEKTNELIDTVKSRLDDLNRLFNGGVQRKIVRLVKTIDGKRPDIYEKIDLTSIQWHYSEFRRCIRTETTANFVEILSEIRNLVIELSTKSVSKEIYENTERQMTKLLGKFRQTTESLNTNAFNAGNTMVDKYVVAKIEEILKALKGKEAFRFVKKLFKSTEMPDDQSSSDSDSASVPTMKRVPLHIPKSKERHFEKKSILKGTNTDSKADSSPTEEPRKRPIPQPISLLRQATEISDVAELSVPPLSPTTIAPKSIIEQTPKKSAGTIEREDRSSTSSGSKPSGDESLKKGGRHQDRPGTPPAHTDSKPAHGDSTKKLTGALEHEERSAKSPSAHVDESVVGDASKKFKGTSKIQPGTLQIPVDSKVIAGSSTVGDSSKKATKHEEPGKMMKPQATSSNTGTPTKSNSPSISIAESGDIRPLIHKVATHETSPGSAVAGQSTRSAQQPGNNAPMVYQESGQGGHRNDNIRPTSTKCPCGNCLDGGKCGMQCTAS